MSSRSHRFLLSLFSIITSVSLYAAITGTVKDAATGEPLPDAAVRLVNAADSAFVAGVTTGANGAFTLKDIKKGKYILTVSYIGYADDERAVSVGANGAAVRLGVIKLLESAHTLGEVSVIAVKTPIKVMEDTVEYNVDSYHTQPNAVVEDLLKRLPGVDVDSDGKITANGKEISKILVNGKEFFGDDPKVASKNLPVEMIDKLQVVDRKSDEARLTGVDDGEDETVINLTVKRGMDQGWFGNAEGGYGTDKRYQGSFNVNRFWNGNQVTFLGNLNNTNQLGFTDNNGNRFNRFGGTNGITTSRALGVNFNVGNDEIFRVGGNVMYSNTDRLSTSRRNREYLLDRESAYENSNSYARDRGNNISADFRMKWQPDSFNVLEFRPQFSYNHNYSLSASLSESLSALQELVTRSENSAVSKGDSWEASGRLTYSHKFESHRGRSFSLSMNYRLSDVHEKETSYSENIYKLLDETENLDQYTSSHTWANTVGARLTWTEPIGNVANGNFIEAAYRITYRWNNTDKLVYDIPDGYTLDRMPPEGEDPDPDYSNRFRNNYFNQDVRLGYKKTNKNLTLNVGMSLVPQMSKSTDLINADRNIDTRWVLNYAPFLRLRYKFSRTRSLQANYYGRSSQPSMKQLQPVSDISNPMNIVTGNPNLDPSFSHNLEFRFQDFNPDSQRSIMAMAYVSATQNSIISKTTYDAATGGRTTTYVNVNGVWNARIMNMVSLPFSNKKWNFNNFMHVNANHSIGYTNGLRNASMTTSVSVNPAIAFRPDHWEFELRPQYSFTSTENSLQSQTDLFTQSYGGRFDGTYYTPWGLTIQTDVRYSATSGMAAGYNTRTWRWNASVSQQLLRDRSLTLTVRVYDILNQQNSISRNVTANYIDNTEYNSLGRYGMVTLTWRFNTFGKGKTPTVPGDFDQRGPGRGPGHGPGGGAGGGRGRRF